MERKKHMIRWWLYMILLQWCIGLLGFFVLYDNYESLTKSESIQEHYKDTFSLQWHNSAWSTWNNVWSDNNQLSWDIIYTGLVGKIHIGTKNIWWSDYQKKTISYKDIAINPTVHDALDVLTKQSQSLSRDKRTTSYTIRQAQYNNFLQTINDLNFLTKYTNNSSLTNPTYNPRANLDSVINNDDSQILINYFTSLESKFIKLFMTREEKIGRNNWLLTSDKFAYVYNQLHIDEANKYKDHIDLAAKIFNLNPNLIKACIFVEQLRAFYTFKWLFKSVAQTNSYLTIMSKQSFGIGGMKLQTAEQLEQRLATNEPTIYQKYFSYENPNNISQQRLTRFTDTKNYYYQILYSAGLLYRYNTERKKAGYNISSQPGLIATMYNIWYSEPHANADIGWSFMNIEWDKYSFWWLAMLIYYYLEIYG